MEEAVKKKVLQTKKCPHCGEKILAIAKVCKHCGQDLTVPVVAQETVEVPVVKEFPTFEQPAKQKGWFYEYFGCFVSKQYADFKGRTDRKHFWIFMLMCGAIYLFFTVMVQLCLLYVNWSVYSVLNTVYTIVRLALCIPLLAAQVRRLRDAGKSGWTVLLNLVPVVGWIILLCFYCQKTKKRLY